MPKEKVKPFQTQTANIESVVRTETQTCLNMNGETFVEFIRKLPM